ncbi:MAG: 16S rRNA (cytosine(1402)-N(4))-methyltransferase RsmH [Eubacteriales bacterium]
MEKQNLEKQEKPHVRRVRYKGTHPRNYKEKYKELQPEKYVEDVEAIIKKGKTPAGMHISICVNEIMDILNIKPGEIGLDCTLGYGGHTKEMLTRLEGKGHMYATDVDPIESEKTRERLKEAGFDSERLTIKLRNFGDIDLFKEEGIAFDFAMADLGVSSMQIDNPERGFTFKQDGPLDLRLNPMQGISAAERLKELTQIEIEEMLVENSDEPYAEEIAKTIIKHYKSGGMIETTKELAGVIEEALHFIPEKEQKEAVKKSCQRSFQALRIDINNEYEVLFLLLEKLPVVLNSGGRVAILTFHSGEDRLVKKAFKQGYKQGIYREIAKDVIRPTSEERFVNSRARSAKLRWAIKS